MDSKFSFLKLNYPELKVAKGKTVKSKATKTDTKKVKFEVEKDAVLGRVAEPKNS
jgi:hypothetical protein